MSNSETYPATVKHLTHDEMVARWKELGWGDLPMQTLEVAGELPCQHKDTRNVAEGMIVQRCNLCGAGKNEINDWCEP